MLGRDWLKDVELDWRKSFKMEADGNQAEPRLKTFITQYSEVFEEVLGTFTGPKAKIHVKENAYAMKGKIEEKFKRLQEEGKMETVQFSEWAAPIVPILKPDNSIRICGDYKTTVNQVSRVDNYYYYYFFI